jgi:hypothetical protein
MLPETESCACAKEDKCACTQSSAPSDCQEQKLRMREREYNAYHVKEVSISDPEYFIPTLVVVRRRNPYQYKM